MRQRLAEKLCYEGKSTLVFFERKIIDLDYIYNVLEPVVPPYLEKQQSG